MTSFPSSGGGAERSIDLTRVIQDLVFAVDGLVFVVLAGYGAIDAFRRRSIASAWFGGMFSALVVVVLAGRFAQQAQLDHPALGQLMVAILALVPFCLYRFTRMFAHGARFFDLLSTALTVIVIGAALTIPIPPDRADWSFAAELFVWTFLAHWLVLSAVSATYFFLEANQSQGVAARRMRLFAWATIVLAGALLLAGSITAKQGSAIDAVIQLSGATAAVLFWFALVPPRPLRIIWRAREAEDYNLAVRSLLSGEAPTAVRQRLLQAAVRMTGARGAALFDADGTPLDTLNLDREQAIELARAAEESPDGGTGAMRAGRLLVAVGDATPFFGVDERRLLDTLGAFGQIAEEQAGVLERERIANQRLREVDQLKTEFVAMVAHDLRSPMAVISGFADTIRDRWDDLPDTRKLQFLDMISRNTHSLAEFVEDVLQVARLESGQFHYDLQPFHPRTVVDRIVTEFGLAHPDLQLTIDVPEDLPAAVGDEERNWQILTNLLSNAMKFSPDAARVCVQVRCLDAEDAVSISVRDEGVGISPEDQLRLFQRFSRVGERRATAGTGLGLYIVKSMVEAQGGRIWVQSAPGNGSTFTYTLPCAPTERETA